MKIQENDTGYGTLQYGILEEYAVLIQYKGRDISLTIPDYVAGKPVTIIGKKAFLGVKELQELLLPESITTIQDWAFASCRSLEAITLPHRKLSIGQGILKDCDKLQQIMIARKETERMEVSDGVEDSGSAKGISYLLAAAMNKLDAFYLFDPLTAGSRSWLEQWDARMLALMEQEDAEGFSKMLLCGEEDYGSRENNLDYYVEQRRRFKVRLAMLRLTFAIGLSDPVKKELLSYLQAHTKGKSSEETWKVVLEEHGDDRRYYQFLLDHDCITNENFDAILEDMGDYHTEMKAFLMHYKSENMEKEDAFAGLEFDLS